LAAYINYSDRNLKIAGMTSAQQHQRVAVVSILALAVYFPTAWYLGSTYVSDMAPAPPGAVRQVFNLQKYKTDGIGYVEGAANYRVQPGLEIYEDGRRLTPATGLEEVNSNPGRFAQETGVGIIVSATDGSDVTKSSSRLRFWVVKPPDAPR
jgi:hypothetical protein